MEPRTLYVYYKVPETERAIAWRGIHALQKRLSEELPAIRCQLMQRPTSVRGLETWMEIYSTPLGVSDDAETTICSAAAAVPELVSYPRAVESFIPLRSI
jgi:hypothetical protein